MNPLLAAIEEVKLEQPKGTSSTASGFGSDLWCELDLHPNMVELSPNDPLLVAQNALRMITTDKGTYPDDPLIGMNLFNWLRRPADIHLKAALESAIKAEILRDDRVESVVVIVTPTADRTSASVSVQGICAQGPFKLVLSMSDSNVVLREISAQ